VITEATLKLTPLPEKRITLRALYSDMTSAARAVSAIMAQPVTPATLEFMDGKALTMIRKARQTDLPEQAGAMLMIEVDGSAASIEQDAQKVAAAAKLEGCLEVMVADTEEKVAALWALRKALSPTLRTVAPKKINEDVVVPVSHIPELVNGLQQLGEKHAITIVNFGHAGNGNIHVNLLVNPDDAEEMARADACLAEVFTLVLKLEGTLSGEHGIGLVKRDFVTLEIDPVTLELMQKIKQQFDPHGILNPGKKLPGI
jgi:D-lactate dehydrogenase